MQSILEKTLIGQGVKPCNRCEQVLPFSAYYRRSGYGTEHRPAIMPGHFNSECKACMKIRSQGQLRRSPWESAVVSEQMAIDYLMSHGIWAQTGKATSAPDVDVVAWGAVWIEVKRARLRRGVFMFRTTPAQQDRGFLAHVILLVCDQGEDTTYHVFSPSSPEFYHDDGRLKDGFTYRPGREVATNQGRGSTHQLTRSIMESAQDNVGLIWEAQKRIHQQLRDGKRPTYGVTFR